jgi:uncharacterized protein YcbX
MTEIKGYMVFAGDQPMITDMNPHPSWAPQDKPETFDAKGWADCFTVVETLEEAQESIKEDIEDMLQAVKDGDLEDYDDDYQPFALPVTISDAGEIVIFDEAAVKETSRHKMEDMYTSFGMEVPKNDGPDEPSEGSDVSGGPG